jgi:UDP-perosamine 4-acetyltransferase
MSSPTKLLLIGAGGHAKVLLSLLQATGRMVDGVCDPKLRDEGVAVWRGIPVLGGDEVLESLDPAEVSLVNGIGQVPRGLGRRSVQDRLASLGFGFPVLVHPAAWVDSTAKLAHGAQVMAGAVIQADAAIGENTIINTRAVVEHDCSIGPDVHVAPGGTICGGVQVGAGTFIGSGATVIQGLRIGEGCTVGAGTTVIRDIRDGSIYLGPGRRLR